MSASLRIVFNSFDDLKNTLKLNTQKGVRIVVDIPAEKIISRNSTLDANLSDLEIMRFLESRAEKFFGQAADQLCLDYKKEKCDDASKQIITVFAAHRSMVHGICDCFLSEKIQLEAIHVINEQDINLLPWRKIALKKIRQQQFMRAILYALISFFLLLFLNFFFEGETQKIKKNTESIEKIDSRIIIPNARKHAVLLKKLHSLSAAKLSSIKTNQTILQLLSQIANDLPNSITLNTMSLTGQSIKLTGSSTSLSDIHNYNIALQKNSVWKNSQLSEIHNDQQNKLLMDFTIEMAS